MLEAGASPAGIAGTVAHRALRSLYPLLEGLACEARLSLDKDPAGAVASLGRIQAGLAEAAEVCWWAEREAPPERGSPRHGSHAAGDDEGEEHSEEGAVWQGSSAEAAAGPSEFVQGGEEGFCEGAPAGRCEPPQPPLTGTEFRERQQLVAQAMAHRFGKGGGPPTATLAAVEAGSCGAPAAQRPPGPKGRRPPRRRGVEEPLALGRGMGRGGLPPTVSTRRGQGAPFLAELAQVMAHKNLDDIEVVSTDRD